jgi:hypothetical protein
MHTLHPSQILLAAIFALSTAAAASPWATRQTENPEGPGTALDILHQGKPAARFIFGDGQMKPFLHVFGADGELLTNPGIDAEGKEAGRFPHHRGIFIGWNQIRSDLGNDDLWHFRRKEHMEVTNVRESVVTDDYAEIIADIVWRSSNKDAEGDDVLVRETRTLRISKPEESWTIVVDATFDLTAARDITLGGDLQHAGVHFRAHREVANRAGDTIYMWAPDVAHGGGRIINDEMRWCRLVYPIGGNWYSTIQLNAPGNPTEELSWRDYGRFGFFFKREMKKDESLTLNHRFITSTVIAPGDGGYDEAAAKLIRERSDEAYKKYTQGL